MIRSVVIEFLQNPIIHLDEIISGQKIRLTAFELAISLNGLTGIQGTHHLAIFLA